MKNNYDNILYSIEVDISSKIKAGCDITPEEYIKRFKEIFSQFKGDNLETWEYEIRGIFDIARDMYGKDK